MTARRVELGLRENAAQFTLLVAINALVDSIPPAPEHQAEIVAANRSGQLPASRT